MRLREIEISGFRGFSGTENIDLSADATILVGTNGLGKTSLLDAIHWGLTGRLSRLGSGDKQLVSLYSETGQARVSLTLNRNDEEVTISRSFDGEKQLVSLRYGEEKFRGTSAKARIFELLWPGAEGFDDGDEVFSSAVTNSIYLQQDRLRAFLETSSQQERFDVISRLVGAGKLTELNARLESESRSWSIATTKKRNELEPLIEQVETLEARLASLSESAKSGQDFNNSQWAKWWGSIVEHGISKEQIPKPTTSSVEILLDQVLRDIRALRSKTQREMSLIGSVVEELKNAPPDTSKQVEKLTRKLYDANAKLKGIRESVAASQKIQADKRKRQLELREKSEQEKALATLALKFLEDRCPVCQQSYDIEKTRTRLEKLIRSEETEIEGSSSEDFELLLESESDAVNEATRIRELLSDAKSAQERFVRWQHDCSKMTSEFDVNFDKDAKEALQTRLLVNQELDVLLSSFLVDGEQLALGIVGQAARARIGSTEKDLFAAKERLNRYQHSLKKREETSVKTKYLIEGLRNARADLVIAKLNDIEPLLQRIFTRIDPHPTFRAVKFVAEIIRGKGCLDTEIQDSLKNKFSKAPETILSSSQFNALAVSIFLSLNLSLRNLPLETAILDDPIQSLDEINLLGLVDLLRRVRDQRQIIVSTHDARFGRLLARKLRPADTNRKTSLVELRGWDRAGPQIVQYSLEPDATPLFIANARQ